jgi:uncharacterized membrane protein
MMLYIDTAARSFLESFREVCQLVCLHRLILYMRKRFPVLTLSPVNQRLLHVHLLQEADELPLLLEMQKTPLLEQSL